MILELAVTLSPVKDIEWTKDSLRRVDCRRVQTSGAERTNNSEIDSVGWAQNRCVPL